MDTDPVIIDAGSAVCTAGLVADSPSVIMPCVVGRQKHEGAEVGMGQPGCYVGAEALSKKAINGSNIDLKCPIERGLVTNWDDMEQIWHHIFYKELEVAPEAQKVMLTDAPFNPKTNREKMVEIMFDTFAVPAMYVANQAALSIFAAGRLTGIVIQSGDGVTHAVPINNTTAIPSAVKSLGMAGCDLTDHLSKLLEEKGHSFSTPAVRKIKEELCYVVLDFDKEMATETSYILPDGQEISIGSERFRVPEALFHQSAASKEGCGLSHLIYNSIKKCNSKIQKELFSNIVLAGGNTMLPGIVDRLKRDISALVPSDTEVRIIAPPDRENCAWLGGSILSSLSSFEQVWVTRDEYNDSGPSIIHKKMLNVGPALPADQQWFSNMDF